MTSLQGRNKKRKKRTWDEIATEAQTHRDASIDRVWPSLPRLPLQLSKNVTGIPDTLLDESEKEITHVPPEALVAMLAKGEVTATTVTKAFLRRAAIAQRLVRILIFKLTFCISQFDSHPPHFPLE